MSRRAKNARPVVVYSAQATTSEKFPIAYDSRDPGAIVERLSVGDAAAQVKAGHARWLRGGTAIQLFELARIERIPRATAITPAEMMRNADGCFRAVEKVKKLRQLRVEFIAGLMASA